MVRDFHYARLPFSEYHQTALISFIYGTDKPVKLFQYKERAYVQLVWVVPITLRNMEKTTEQLAVEAYAKDLEEVNQKHNMRIVPKASLEVAYINEPKPVLDLL